MKACPNIHCRGGLQSSDPTTDRYSCAECDAEYPGELVAKLPTNTKLERRAAERPELINFHTVHHEAFTTAFRTEMLGAQRDIDRRNRAERTWDRFREALTRG